jgi:hypothetical protein
MEELSAMNLREQAVQALADRVGCRPGTTAERQQSLEESLVPLVRCALRTGRGHPRLLGWLRRTLPSVPGPHQAGMPVDPEVTAAPVARLLCRSLLQRLPTSADRAPALETVAGL